MNNKKRTYKDGPRLSRIAIRGPGGRARTRVTFSTASYDREFTEVPCMPFSKTTPLPRQPIT